MSTRNTKNDYYYMSLNLCRSAARQALVLANTLQARLLQRRAVYKELLSLIPRCQGFELREGAVVGERGGERVEIRARGSRAERSQNPFSSKRVSIFQRQFAQQQVKKYIQQQQIPVPPESFSALVDNAHQLALDTRNPFALPDLPPLPIRIIVYKTGSDERTTLHFKEQLGRVQLLGLQTGEDEDSVFLEGRNEQVQRIVRRALDRWNINQKVFLMVRLLSHAEWQNQTILELQACSKAFKDLSKFIRNNE